MFFQDMVYKYNKYKNIEEQYSMVNAVQNMYKNMYMN